MNIILVGPNGSGKSTLSHELYLRGFHLFKLSPHSNNNNVQVGLAMQGSNIVFDRWSVVDLIVYRQDYTLFNMVKKNAKTINNNNLIIFLENDLEDYNVNDGESRVINRPDKEELVKVYSKYNKVKELFLIHNIIYYTVKVRKDINKTLGYILHLYSVIIKENIK